MTTARQTSANRKNARRSTGPKSERGKAVVALNAMKHGLLSGKALLETEDDSELIELGKRLRSTLRPEGELECLLADRVLSCAWRLRRVISVETGIFRQEMDGIFGEREDVGLAFIRDGNGADAFSKLSRYESAIERAMYRALHELQRLRASRAGQPVPPPVVVELEMHDGQH